MACQSHPQWGGGQERQEHAHQFRAGSSKGAVVGALHDVEGVDVWFEGELPLVTGAPAAGDGDADLGSRVPGKGDAYGLLQVSFVQDAVAAHLDVRGPRLW